MVARTEAQTKHSTMQRTATWVIAPADHLGAGPWVLRGWMATVVSWSPGWRAAFSLVREYGGDRAQE